MAVYFSMAPILSLIVALSVAFASSAYAGQQSRNVLLPTQVAPPPGGPVSTTLPFEVTWPVACPCTLSVVNGSAGSGPLSPTRVLAGSVWVDGALVLTPLQLSAVTANANATLNLSAGTHDVRLELLGPVTSFVTVRVSGTITTVDLSVARSNHTATLMPNGSVIVAGGDSASIVLSSTERITANANHVEPAAPLFTPRAGQAAALVAGRTIIFSGGRDAAADLSSAEVWTTAGGAAPGLPLDDVRRSHTATTLIDGRVLILGGRNGSGESLNTGLLIDPRPDAFTDDTYNPAAAAVTSLGSILQVARAGHSATLLPDGRILIVGGRGIDAVDLASIEIVDPATMTSVLLPIALATARTNHTATLRSNGNIVVIGGRNGSTELSSIERIQPALDAVTSNGAIGVARAGHTATVIRNGEILIAGGTTSSGPTAHTELGPRPPDDTASPTVLATFPAANAVDVGRGVVIGVRMSEPIDPDTVSSQSVELRTSTGALVASSVAIVDQGLMLAVRPDSLLAGDTYTLSINGVADRGGLALAPVSFGFTTVPAPVITALLPSAGGAGIEVTVTGSGFGGDPDDHRLSFGALLVPVVPIDANTLRFTAPALPLGSYPVSLRTRGGLANAPAPFVIVNPVPTLMEISPSTVDAGSAAFTLTLTGTNFIDGATAVIGETTLPATFVSSTSLHVQIPASLVAVAAALQVRVVNPAPGGGASNALPLEVRSVGPPVTAVTLFPRGMSLSIGGTHQFTAEARFADGTETDITSTASWSSSAGTVLAVSASGLANATAEGTSTITVSFGGLSASADVRVYAGEAIPPDPVDVAPELSAIEPTTMADATRFLYEGPNAIQRDVTPGAIEPLRVSVIRGQLTTRDGQPLSGARISIKDHPEFGYTLSRLDGGFDIAANGGGSVVVDFTKAGYLPVQRRNVIPSAEFQRIDVVLVALDPQVTEVDLSAATPITVARGTVVTDESGIRQATVLFPQGTTATMVLPDGTSQPLTTLHVRATEYTVGPNGPAAMPGSLPPASAYTYAVELSADEAIAAGAASIQFSAPVPHYVENFLGFPVGAAVPTGYYDRTLAGWIPSTNGIVLKILSIAGDGRAEIDLDGDAMPDDAAALGELGITDAERITLGTTYTAGQSLWRIAIPHFSVWDHNWPQSAEDSAFARPTLGPPTNGDTRSENKCETPGSIIECQDQVLGERQAITGTSFTLNYRSDRTPARQAHRLSIPLTDPSVPAVMDRIVLEVIVAGRQFIQEFAAVAGEVAEFAWDGLDAYGRPVHGVHPAHVIIRHIYRRSYISTPYFQALARGDSVFGLPAPITEPQSVPAREISSIPVFWVVPIGPPPRSIGPVAGWSIDVHHSFLPGSQTLLFGDGRRRTKAAAAVTPVDVPQHLGFFGPTTVAAGAVYYPSNTPDGTAIFRKAPNVPPVSIGVVPFEVHFVVDPDGVVHYAMCDTETDVTIYRLAPGGASEAIATRALPAGEECEVALIARGPDGTLFVDTTTEVFQKLPGGPLVNIGGTRESSSLAVGPDGSVYRAVQMPSTPTTLGLAIERLAPTGAITVIAGGKRNATGLGGGGLAVDVQFGGIHDIAAASDGSVLVVSQLNGVYRLQHITSAGRVFTVAGGVASPPCCLPGPPAIRLNVGTPATSVSEFQQVEFGDDGWVYLFGQFSYRFRLGLMDGLMRMAADDGSEIHEFTETGRHTRTLDALTGATRYTFSYDPAGRLTAIADGDGLTTQIERDATGAPTAIVAPFGQRTTVTQDGNGWLATIVAPGNRTTTLTTTASGLLTDVVDANGNPYEFTYDAAGRLIHDAGPADGSETLARTALPDGGWETTLTSAMGRVRRYRTEILPATGAQRLTVTAADGTSSVTTSFPDRSSETVAADGMRTNVTMIPDPRFGLDAPIPQTVTVRSPAGRLMTTTRTRTVTLPNPDDLSTLVQTDDTRVNNRLWRTVFTGSTRTVRTTSPAGRVTTSTIDAQGRVTRTQVGTLTPIDFTYDPQGRLTTTTQGPRVATIAYDGSGRPSVLTDALTRTVEFDYDAADRVSTQTLPDTRTIGFDYDNNSNVTSLTPPGRPAHTFTYTPINFTSSYTPPAVAGTGPTGYLFNEDRQPIEVQRPDGQTTLFAYGPTTGRLNSVTFSRGSLNYGYDTAGRVSSLSDPGGVTLTYAYDGALPLRETWSGPVTGTVSRTFDNDLGVASEFVNFTQGVGFTYDADRLLTGAGTLTIARHPQNGLVTSTTLGTTTDAYSYNDFGEPSRQTAVANSVQVFDVQITRDDLGRITQRIEVVDGITRVFQYDYDLAGRLEAVTRDGTLVARYTYDANGNRLTGEGAAHGGALPIVATYDDQDRLLTYGNTTYTYTANGELQTKTVGGQTTSYVYDTLGNLVQVTQPDGDVITYTIDGRGRRVGKSVNGVRVKGWLYADQLRPVAELDGSGNVVSRFVYGAKGNVPEYMIRGGITYRIFSDHLGSPRVVANATSGEIVQRLDFHAFGETIQDSNAGWQPFGFGGGLYDPDTALIRYGRRDYDPGVGKWNQSDPIRFHGGDVNLYTYGLGEPVNNIDPSGLSVPVIGAIVGGVVGGMTGALSAYGTNQSGKQIALSAIFGAVAGAGTGARTSSSLFLGLANALAETVNQLVSSIGCGGLRLNPAAIGAAAFAGVLGGKGAQLLSGLPGMASQSPAVREILRAIPGLGASGAMLPANALGEVMLPPQQ